MRRTVLILSLFAVFVLAAAAQETGLTIMSRANDRQTGNDMTARVRMSITSKTGNVKIREFDLSQLTGKDGSESSLLRFIQPADVKGTAFLTLSPSEGEKTQYIYLPSMKKTSRIAASDKDKPFMGSDLSYDDFGKRNLDDYAYTLLGEETVGGTPAWKVEAKAVSGNRTNPRVVSWVGKDSSIILRAELYDKSGKLAKELDVKKVGKISGYWTMEALTMKNLLTGSTTDLSFSDIHYDSGLSQSLFSKEALAR